jgi:tetratricopeptide (TPR) repeat protein
MRLLAVPLWILILAAAAPADRVADYHRWHHRAVQADDNDPIDRAINRFEAALETDPDDHLARVYLGSAHTLRAAETFWGPSKLKYLRRGEKLMNRAVEAAPDNPRVRFIRAVNAYRVPERFKQRPTAVADFSKLLPVAESGGHGLGRRERQAILYYAWLTFSEEDHPGEARRARAACIRIDPDSEYADLARGQ